MYTVAQALQYVNSRTSNGAGIVKSIAGYAVEEDNEEVNIFDWTEYGAPNIPEGDIQWLTDLTIDMEERDMFFRFCGGEVTFLEEREYDQVPRPWTPEDDETIELDDD